jgi:phosphoglycolate phosphatase-like HAD superfamily hydrolase
MSNIKLVVLDYDVTFTDIRDGAPIYDACYVRALANFLGKEDLRQEWERLKMQVRRDSPDLAWQIANKAIAPAAADPFSLSSEATRKVIADLSGEVDLSDAQLSNAQSELFNVAYPQTPFPFRPDARVVLGILRNSKIAVSFVTNSATDTVQNHLQQALFPSGLGALQVHGGARKFLLGEPSTPDPHFSALPMSRNVKGLNRPILLQRGKYFDVLRQFWEDPNSPATPETTLVVGDVWELDLAMPAALGCCVHLIERDNTYQYEFDEVASLGARGSSSKNLLPLLRWLK